MIFSPRFEGKTQSFRMLFVLNIIAKSVWRDAFPFDHLCKLSSFPLASSLEKSQTGPSSARFDSSPLP